MRRLLLILITMILCLSHAKAQTSKVNVTIDGPGVVDEYLTVDKDGKKQLRLKAVPSKFLGDVTFDGWSGDATGSNEELVVSPDKAQNIHATFTYHRPVKKYPLIDLKQSWADMGKPMYVEEPGLWESEWGTAGRGYSYLPVDYNRDGYIDYVDFPKKGGMGIDNHRENARFRLGKPDGTMDEDPLNDDRMLGTVYAVQTKYADFNDDGYPDFLSVSTGYDREGSTGDYPLILMSGPDGVYTDLRFTDFDHGNFHQATTGDFDNDGDIDVLFWDCWHSDGENSLYLENDGQGNFKQHDAREIIDLGPYLNSLPRPFFAPGDVEFIDLNNDNYHDLIFCASDALDETTGYTTPPFVLWGDGSGKFGGTNYTFLPPPRLGYGISVGMVFYDLNGDGIKEIIVNKNGDGLYGDTEFYIGNYFQVCELEGDHYVDKTSEYIPIENTGFNENASETRIWIEEIDGTPYLCTGGQNDDHYLQGVGVGAQKLYAIRNGILEPVVGQTKTKIESYDEGIPLYVDGNRLTDMTIYFDGVNPIDTMAEHHWVGYSTWDPSTESSGSGMWRVNLRHRKDTHFGRTCIWWNRDGQDPKKKMEEQLVNFSFISDIDIQKLADEGYYLELYIKNTDPDLTFIVSFETHSDNYDANSFSSVSETVSRQHVEGGMFTGEWQRVLLPLSSFKGEGSLKKVRGIVLRVDGGDLNNIFYLDDIRIRRLAESTSNDYDRAFIKDYLSTSYAIKERTSQITSQEFKSLLRPLVAKFAPTKKDYFNSRISDYDLPLTRNIAVGMAYYTATCIGADTNNYMNESEQPEDFWVGCWEPEVSMVLPYANDEPTTPIGPDDNFWMEWQEIMQAVMWNSCHVSDFSNFEVIPRDKEANTYHWLNPFTWEDAICAITRLCDSIDRESAVTLGDANSDNTINAEDIKEIVNYLIGKPSDKFNIYAADANGDGEINAADIVTIVNVINSK